MTSKLLAFQLRSARLILIFLSIAAMGVRPSQASAPPLGTWERWIIAIRSNGKGGLPGRPDGKAFDAELPLWVDCHLSWYFDRPVTETSSEKNQLRQRIVLRSTTKLCQGQLEQWAH